MKGNPFDLAPPVKGERAKAVPVREGGPLAVEGLGEGVISKKGLLFF